LTLTRSHPHETTHAAEPLPANPAAPGGLAAPARLAAPANPARSRLAGPDLLLSLALGAMGFFGASIGVLIVMLSEQFGVRPATLSWMGSAFGVGLLLAAVAGPTLLRRGPRPVLVGAALGYSIGVSLIALAPTLPLVALGVAIQALAGAGVILVIPTLLTGSRAAARITRVNAVASITGILSPMVIGGMIAAGVEGRLALLLSVGVMLLVAVVAARAPEPRPDVRIPSPDAAAAPHPTSRPATPAGAVSTDRADDVVRRPSKATVARRWLAIVLAVAAEFSFAVWAVARLAESGLDTATAATLGAAFPVGMGVGRVVGPWLIARVPAVPSGAAVAALGTLLVVLGASWPMIAVGLVLAGFGLATLYPVTLVRLMTVPGLPPSLGSSLGALASGTAITVAPTVVGVLGDAVDMRLAFLLVLPMLAGVVGLHGREGVGARR